jgi:hypothetical protein
MSTNNSQYLSIVGYAPRLGDENVGTSGEIQIRFNLPVDQTQVNTNAELNKYLILTNMTTDVTVPVIYRSWDGTHRMLSVAPSGALSAGGTYQITVRRTLTSDQGRGMTSDRNWVFEVEGDPVNPVDLLEPGDSTAHRTSPTLKWSGITIASSGLPVTYDVQVNSDWHFQPPLTWSTDVSSVTSGGTFSTAIGVALTARSSYFWRVRARNASLTGEWSEVRGFWLGESTQASPDTEFLYETPGQFRVDKTYPPAGTPNCYSWPTIRLTFTERIDPATITNESVYLYRTTVDGRGDTNTGAVSGVITTNDTSMVFTPSVDIADNSRYTLVVKATVASTSGNALEEDYQTYFTSEYAPLYGGIISVRSHLGKVMEPITDDEIYFQLWLASLKVNEIFMTRVYRVRRTATFNEVVNYRPPLETAGMKEYTELEAVISILESYYMDLATEAGRRNMLGTFENEVNVDILEELRNRIKELKQERDQVAATYLFKVVVPRVGIKSAYWDENRLGRDLSYEKRPRF